MNSRFLKMGLLILGLSAGPVVADIKVVVIPMQGDDINIYRGTLVTGNSRCSYNNGSFWQSEDCNAPVNAIIGQDAQTQNGVSATTDPRFIIYNGTVEDTLTGLVWLQNAYCYGQTADWPTALQAVVELNSSGSMDGINACGDSSADNNGQQADWRLPSVRELQTLTYYGDHGTPYLVNTSGTGQWSEGTPFSGMQILAEGYWSSTTLAQRSAAEANPDGDDTLDDAMRVNYSDGTSDATSKAATLHVWAVRDKQ